MSIFSQPREELGFLWHVLGGRHSMLRPCKSCLQQDRSCGPHCQWTVRRTCLQREVTDDDEGLPMKRLSVSADRPSWSPVRYIRAFVIRYPLAGPIIWLLSVQYFLVQVLVASAWKSPYSWRLNAISDLGATSCSQFDGRCGCSPLHGLMNVSLILLGLSMTIGAVLMYQEFHRSQVGFCLMAVAGVGAILVGLFAENTIYWAHIAGADLAFLLSNIALIFFGLSLCLPRWFRWYSLASGAVALVALCLFLTHNRFFLGLGGMERVAAYPQTIWLIVFGLYMSKSRNRLAVKRVDTSDS